MFDHIRAAVRNGDGERTAVVFYGIAFDMTAVSSA